MKQAQAAPTDLQPGQISERLWRISSLSLLAVAAFLRLYNLALVPFHHDEGVNGNFLVQLVREGIYTYDPSNYHGPTLYYFSAVIVWILRFLFGESAQNTYGINTVTLRLVPALFGLATVWLVLLLRRRLGTVGTLCAAALLAVSPGAVYLSRYFIHETLFVFFTLGVVVASIKAYEERHPIYVVLASMSAGLLFATKETAVISAAVLAIALFTTQLYLWLRKVFGIDKKSRSQKNAADAKNDDSISLVERFGGPGMIATLIVLALVLFGLINILFYSSFFSNYPKGVYDAVKTFEFWAKTGKESHVHPLTTYFAWLVLQESPLLSLGFVGAALVVWKPNNLFALFAALWAFGLIAAYSLIGYKTPWLCLNFVVPLTLISGHALQVLYEQAWCQLRAVIVVMALAITVSGYQTIKLNFFNYDDERYVYVYAHTYREMLALVNQINQIASVTGEKERLGITIVSRDYWPLPWYLRDYTAVGYHGRMTASIQPIIIASEDQRDEAQSMFGDSYQQVKSAFNPDGSYRLRPGVNLLLYVRKDVLPRLR
ncbi:MAG: flippase activity-associated protein Agl23 [Pyrinomonadaceae bacterium]